MKNNSRKNSMIRVANTVYETNDYDLFSFIEGNRNTTQQHVNKLMLSFQEHHIPVPCVTTDEHYRIFDGQNSYLALKELGLPIYFVKIQGLKLRDVQLLNANLRSWSLADFLYSHCETGNPDYFKFRDFRNKYGFPFRESMTMLSNDRS